jgi:hypothetical protein
MQAEDVQMQRTIGVHIGWILKTLSRTFLFQTL